MKVIPEERDSVLKPRTDRSENSRTNVVNVTPINRGEKFESFILPRRQCR
jgi:hypothetical protein